MSLKDVSAQWDGKTIEPMLQVYDINKADPAFGPELLKSLGDIKSERGITWLVKHHLEQGWRPQSNRETSVILKALPGTNHWEAHLHLLQCLPYLTIASRQTEHLWDHLQSAIQDEAKFVRAWAYHGLYVLAAQHPRFSAQVLEILKRGLDTETAASAKVKIRHALKSLAFD
ncbi:hypothetical protein [Pyruvatibacter sp.]|uniref:hypothetical protein n=1 Tax=Pyruvatibacter sp. TaxID=1981328 RepID=UPI003264AD6F